MTNVGTAGWAVPLANRGDAPAEGSALARYAAIFNCAEINSTFKHEHRASTFARWAETVPADFRFSVKLPKSITHDLRLHGCREEVRAFLASVSPLGDKLGPLLVQLPPSLQFDAPVVSNFFSDLRAQVENRIVCEPRHPTWFSTEADDLLVSMEVSRVAADPSVAPRAATPAGFTDFTYVRLHGSPRVYYSSYETAKLQQVANLLAMAPSTSWCIFDNTASGAAFGDALVLQQMVQALGRPGSL